MNDSPATTAPTGPVDAGSGNASGSDDRITALTEAVAQLARSQQALFETHPVSDLKQVRELYARREDQDVDLAPRDRGDRVVQRLEVLR